MTQSQNVNNNNNMPPGYPVSAGTDKKKVVLACGLLVVMAFMWVRVFAKKADPTSEVSAAQAIMAAQNTSSSKSSFSVEYVSLPVVEGRNDKIVKDIFDISTWSENKGFSGNYNYRDSLSDVDGAVLKEMLEKAVESLELDAVMALDEPEAFINGELYRIGDEIVVETGGTVNVLKILEIGNENVKLGCAGIEVNVGIMQSQKAEK